MHFGPQMVFVQGKTWKRISIRSLHELVKGANQSSFQRLISNQSLVIPTGCLYEEIKGFIEQKFLLFKFININIFLVLKMCLLKKKKNVFLEKNFFLFYRPILPKLYLVSLGI